MVAKGTVTDTIPEEFTLVETEGTSPFTMTKAGETLTPTAVEGGWAFGTPDEQGVYPYVAKFDGKDTITGICYENGFFFAFSNNTDVIVQ